MKKSLLIISLSLLTGYFTNAQKVENVEIGFSETRLPLNPLEGITCYNFTVQTPYPETTKNLSERAQEQYEIDLANHPQTIANAEQKHEEALVEYDNDCELARENFKLETEAYQALSKLERLALSDQRPVLRLPRKPVYRTPPEPRYVEPNVSNMIVFNPSMLADSYLRLDGYVKGTDGISGHVTIYDWEYLDPIQKSEVKEIYNNKTKRKEKTTRYWYETTTKRAANLYLEYKGTILYDGIFEDSGEFKTITTDARPSIHNLEKRSVEDILLNINDYINDNYGLTEFDQVVSISLAKNKSGDYDDLEEARDFAESGLKSYEVGVENADFTEAISIWEAVMREYSPEEKKARIGKKNAKATCKNLLEVGLISGNWEVCEKYLSEFEDMKLNYTEKEYLKKYKIDLEERKLRMAANGI